jgi:quercetin dioxygenase-like cupin family protein
MKPEIILETEGVLVRVMPLAGMGGTSWHFHSQINDTMVGMQGSIVVELLLPQERHILNPGEHVKVHAGRKHRVINPDETPSSYLLIQGVGTYDFINCDDD